MSKELEAFMKYCPIIPSENNFKYWSDYQIALKKYERELQTFTKTFELLKKALTPPTANEVCKALSEWLKEELPTLWNYKVYHDNGGFHYYNNEDYEIYLVDYDEVFERIFFPRYLPPHLITLIGRFYEGLEENKE